jgi:hypothetical protein
MNRGKVCVAFFASSFHKGGIGLLLFLQQNVLDSVMGLQFLDVVLILSNYNNYLLR